MKNNIKHLSFTCLLFLISFSILYSQQEDITWNFPIRPGTIQWDQLDSFEAKLNAYNIPQDIIKSISTNALVDACLSYPEWRLIYTRNSYSQGFGYVQSIFNGFSELVGRDDAADILISKYKTMDPVDIDRNWRSVEIGNYSFKITYIELLLSDPIFLKNLNKDNEKDLLSEAIKKYHSKKTIPQLYSFWGTCPTALICAGIMEKNNNIKELDSERFIFFKNNGLINDEKFTDQIIDISEKFLNQQFNNF